ncbi:hypothetical protein MUK71_03570 [Arthrobacter zhangbolii]|uniref:Uncharacterized protein n=1 Tax=Arthrobacter zhangbolii TaxID=2886936 RepID=A0A9X1SA87_9MICC|nr:hypothetical protein [Arthrobacter zhangbolii]MCC3273281.1 hypothetical protein [Arthrobacter zhangbolii]MCC3295909.1 hypothetical protein [Arthrobacter zhangbolii]UON92736.1 hypothetical protein MUK71_03570 [Arthrobacter zhangbolii]
MGRTRKTAKEIAELLSDGGELPSEEEVRSQGFAFYPRHWLAKWNKSDMPPVPQILGSEGLDARGRKWLTREDLFSMGQQIATPANAIEFYVAVCSWGVGNKARDVYRRVVPLASPDAGERLLKGITAVQRAGGSATAGYQAFSDPAVAYLKGLGPAFFTKLLYFAAGEPAAGGDGHALILDRKVAKSIGWPAKTWWTAQEYQDYIVLIDEICGLLDPTPRPDCVEYALFKDPSSTAGRGAV